MRKKYLIADHITEINSMHDYVHNQCKNYLYTGSCKSDIIINISDSDIEYERRKINREYTSKQKSAKIFTDCCLENIAVHRKFTESIIKDGYFLFHGSAVSVDGIAYMFTACSGTGKTTHTNLWLEYFGNRAEIINGDKPVITVTNDNKAMIFGTPWCGKEGLNINKSVPLKAICFLNRSTSNHIESITLGKAYPALLQQCYRPQDREKMSATLSFLDKLGSCLNLYSLDCNTDIQSVPLAFDGMNKVKC